MSDCNFSSSWEIFLETRNGDGKLQETTFSKCKVCPSHQVLFVSVQCVCSFLYAPFLFLVIVKLNDVASKLRFILWKTDFGATIRSFLFPKSANRAHIQYEIKLREISRIRCITIFTVQPDLLFRKLFTIRPILPIFPSIYNFPCLLMFSEDYTPHKFFGLLQFVTFPNDIFSFPFPFPFGLFCQYTTSGFLEIS